MAAEEVEAALQKLSEGGQDSVKTRDLALVLNKLDPSFWDESTVGKLLSSMGCKGKEDFISLTSFLHALDLPRPRDGTVEVPPSPSSGLDYRLPSEAKGVLCSETYDGKAYLLQHGLSWPSEVDLQYIREHEVVQKVRAFVQRLLFMKPYDINRFGSDYFSGALAAQKRLVLICSDVEEREMLKAAVRPAGLGAEIVTAEWDFQSVPLALSEVVAALLKEHGTFKTVAMCCHGSIDLMGFATSAELDDALQATWKELGEPDLAGGVPDKESALEQLRLERGSAGFSKSGKWMITATHGIDMDTGRADEGVEEAILEMARAASVRLDILACRWARTQMCKSLVQRWEQESKTNIAATSDVTGNAEVGGNWVLETDGIDVSKVYFDEDKLSKWCGCLARGPTRSLALSHPQQENVAHGLFELLDRNGTGILEEFEWAQGCRWARRCLKAKPNAAVAAAIFGKLDEEGTGAVQVNHILEKLPDALRALGIVNDQALEGLHVLRDQRAREGEGDTSILDHMLPQEEEQDEQKEEEVEGRESNEREAAGDSRDISAARPQATWEPPLPQRNSSERCKALEVARRCSVRRSQVLRQFLDMLEPHSLPASPDGEAEAVPLAVRAKKAAWKAVASNERLPAPPEDLELSFNLDSIYAGGENLWISAEVGVAKKDEAEEGEQGVAGETEEGEQATLEDAKVQEGAQVLGAEEEQGESTTRAPADLLVVVDVSGSMRPSLPSVRKCLAQLAGLVGAQDRLALVKFDDQTECVMPWTAMDEEGVQGFREAQKSLVARGGTRFLPVMKMCLNDVLEDELPGRVRSMLFISDGCPDEPDQDILQLVCEECSASNLTIVTAGFGTGVKADLMGSLAQAGCGPFVYIHNEKSIPVQLGRIWAAVAYTSVPASFIVVRPFAGAQITAVEGAFGTAELCLRPDGRMSEQQVMLVQVGPVRHGTSREVAFRLKLPPALQRRPLEDKQLRTPLLEVSLLVETLVQGVDSKALVCLKQQNFLPLQVPSLLADKLLHFPVRFVLENDLNSDFDPRACLKQVAQTLGVEESELELNRVLSGSIIVDFSLKLEPQRAAAVLKDIGSSAVQERLGEEFRQLGYDMKSVKAPGQQVLRRLLQTRFAGALGVAAKTVAGTSGATGDVPELRAVKQLASSELADSLDPPCKGSMASAIAQDCKTILHSVAELSAGGDKRNERMHLHHDMLQLQAAHVAQYKCQAPATSLEAYEVKEAKVAASRMEAACAGARLVTALLESSREDVEMRTHLGPQGQVGAFLLLRPRPGGEDDFAHLAREVCPTFQVSLRAEDSSDEPLVACAYPVHAAHMMPLQVKSNHPTTLDDRCGGKVTIPFARRLKVTVDGRSCAGGSSLSFYVDCTSQRPFKVIHRSDVPSVETSETFFVKGADLWYTYEHAKGASLAQISETWGFAFEVQVAEDKEGQAPESRTRGMLLQARFAPVPPRAYNLSAKLSQRIFEVPPFALSTCELVGGATEFAALVNEASSCLLLSPTTAQARGLRSPARLLGFNDSGAVNKSHLCSLAKAVPKTHTLQATILSSAEFDQMPINEFEKEKLTAVPADLQQKFSGSLRASL